MLKINSTGRKSSLPMNLLPLSLESLPARCRARLMIEIAIVVACGGLCSSVPAVNPPPDGGYPGGNTAEGEGDSGALRPASATRPPVPLRFTSTRRVPATRPLETKRSFSTQPAPTTRPAVMGRFPRTEPAASTSPPVFMRSLTT